MISIKKIDKLILKPFLELFLVALVTTLFVIVLNIFLVFLNDFIGKGLGIWNYFLLSAYVAATALPHALPLAIMFASIVSMGNLGESLELTSLKSAGISISRIMKPLLIFAAGISIFAFFLNSYIVPKAAVKFLTLLYDMRQKKPNVAIKEGIFYDGIPGYSIRIGKKDRNADTIHDIMIYDHTKKDSLPSLTIAQSGSIYMQNEGKQMVIELRDGHNYFDIKQNEDLNQENEITNFARSNFKKERLIIGLDSLQFSRSKDEIFSRSRRAKNREQLKKHILELNASRQEIRKYLAENFDEHFEITKDLSFEGDVNYNSNLEGTNNVKNIKDLLKIRKESGYESDASTFAAVEACKNSIKEATKFRDYVKKCIKHDYEIEIDKNTYELELYKMFTWAVSCLSIMLIGASLGAVIKKGGLGVPLIIAGLLTVIHYIIEITGEKWSKFGVISTINGAWAGNYVIIPVAIFFYILAYRDTRLLEPDFYIVLINKFKSRMKK